MTPWQELSGFSREELIGQPHNVVRHPDMPKEAFGDLWRCLKAGGPWSGYIKNRRKDGGYYWVHAFTSPLRENGRVVGYESVRRKAPPEIVDRMADGYRRLKAGSTLAVENGRLVRNGDVRRVVRLARRDEVGRMADAYNAMMANLQAILINLQQAASETGVQSRSVAAASGGVAGEASAVSDASASTAAAVEQVTVAIGEVANNAEEAAQAARASAADAQQGIDMSRRAAQDVRALADTVQHTTITVERLSQSAGDIGRIVAVISEIASQTNLLALNAAIEAARAGEQGRGFAVVADEVRKLSERANQSTAEITGIIASLNTETRAALDSIKAGDAQVRISVEQVVATEQALEGIKTSAANSLRLIVGIELATREQSSAANEIARNVEQIARMSESSAGAIRAIAGSSQALAAVATGLNETLARVQV